MLAVDTLSGDQLSRYRESVFRDPVGWIKTALGVELWEKQREVAEAVRDHKHVAVRSSNAVGKTYLAACLGLWYLNHSIPGYVITTSSSWRSVELAIWPAIHKVLMNAPVREFRSLTPMQTKLILNPQWGIFGVSAERPENFAGFRTSGGVFVIADEASALVSEIHEAILGLTASGGSRVLYLGNPLRGDGPFADCFKSPGWKKVHISALDTPNVREGREVIPGLATREWVEERRLQWGAESPAYQVRVLGEFPKESEEILIPLAWIEAAMERTAPPAGKDEPLRIGVDIGRTGDQTALVAVRGNRVERMEIFPRIEGGNLMDVCGRIAAKIATLNPSQVNIDAIGIGAGVVDRLQELGFDRVNGVNVASSARKPERFQNLRVEGWWNLREWIHDNAVLPRDGDLLRDLSAIRVDGYTSRGQLRLEPKELTKKRLGRSPDRGDALMLALLPAEELVPLWWVDL